MTTSLPSASPSPVRVALIGVGPMAEQHVRAIAEVDGLEIVACAARRPERAADFAARHAIPRAVGADELLARPDADAFWIVAPADAMADLALRADSHGLPMFLEKPVGLDLAETRAAAAAVASPAFVGVNRRFYEVMRAARRIMGEAGGTRFVEIHMPEDIRPLAQRYAAPVLERWQFGNSIHLIDLFRFFAGEPAQVFARPQTRDPFDRSYSAQIDFEGGARGLFNAQWYAPGGWRVALYADGVSVTLAPVETGVVLRMPGRQRSELVASGPDARLKPGLHGQAEAFRDFVRSGRLPEGAVDLKDYVRSVALVDAITLPAAG